MDVINAEIFALPDIVPTGKISSKQTLEECLECWKKNVRRKEDIHNLFTSMVDLLANAYMSKNPDDLPDALETISETIVPQIVEALAAEFNLNREVEARALSIRLQNALHSIAERLRRDSDLSPEAGGTKRKRDETSEGKTDETNPKWENALCQSVYYTCTKTEFNIRARLTGIRGRTGLFSMILSPTTEVKAWEKQKLKKASSKETALFEDEDDDGQDDLEVAPGPAVWTRADIPVRFRNYSTFPPFQSGVSVPHDYEHFYYTVAGAKVPNARLANETNKESKPYKLYTVLQAVFYFAQGNFPGGMHLLPIMGFVPHAHLALIDTVDRVLESGYFSSFSEQAKKSHEAILQELKDTLFLFEKKILVHDGETASKTKFLTEAIDRMETKNERWTDVAHSVSGLKQGQSVKLTRDPHSFVVKDGSNYVLKQKSLTWYGYITDRNQPSAYWKGRVDSAFDVPLLSRGSDFEETEYKKFVDIFCRDLNADEDTQKESWFETYNNARSRWTSLLENPADSTNLFREKKESNLDDLPEDSEHYMAMLDGLARVATEQIRLRNDISRMLECLILNHREEFDKLIADMALRVPNQESKEDFKEWLKPWDDAWKQFQELAGIHASIVNGQVSFVEACQALCGQDKFVPNKFKIKQPNLWKVYPGNSTASPVPFLDLTPLRFEVSSTDTPILTEWTIAKTRPTPDMMRRVYMLATDTKFFQLSTLGQAERVAQEIGMDTNFLTGYTEVREMESKETRTNTPIECMRRTLSESISHLSPIQGPTSRKAKRALAVSKQTQSYHYLYKLWKYIVFSPELPSMWLVWMQVNQLLKQVGNNMEIVRDKFSDFSYNISDLLYETVQQYLLFRFAKQVYDIENEQDENELPRNVLLQMWLVEIRQQAQITVNPEAEFGAFPGDPTPNIHEDDLAEWRAVSNKKKPAFGYLDTAVDNTKGFRARLRLKASDQRIDDTLPVFMFEMSLLNALRREESRHFGRVGGMEPGHGVSRQRKPGKPGKTGEKKKSSEKSKGSKKQGKKSKSSTTSTSSTVPTTSTTSITSVATEIKESKAESETDSEVDLEGIEETEEVEEPEEVEEVKEPEEVSPAKKSKPVAESKKRPKEKKAKSGDKLVALPDSLSLLFSEIAKAIDSTNSFWSTADPAHLQEAMRRTAEEIKGQMLPPLPRLPVLPALPALPALPPLSASMLPPQLSPQPRVVQAGSHPLQLSQRLSAARPQPIAMSTAPSPVVSPAESPAESPVASASQQSLPATPTSEASSAPATPLASAANDESIPEDIVDKLDDDDRAFVEEVNSKIAGYKRESDVLQIKMTKLKAGEEEERERILKRIQELRKQIRNARRPRDELLETRRSQN
jgi:hypothetical protein